ncbi:asparagine synthase C-terminal domain-containing protein [Candidatus Woesearchaeota archaeon]|nr:asparagine synthase C-terminal domain-containing protein [Candidatus Woesearchaeota archaeon]
MNIIDKGELISEKEWIDFIASIETDFDSLETNKERAKRKLKEKILESIKKNKTESFGILFSGGIDSSLIALLSKNLGFNFTCYSVGLENAKDVEFAKKVADNLGFRLKVKIISLDELGDIIKKVVKILNEPDFMKVGVGSVTYSASLVAKDDGINAVFTGLGSEEIFAGYQRHADALAKGFEEVHKSCFEGLKAMWKRDFVRDFSVTKAVGVDAKLPFLDEDVIKTAMSVHPMHKIDKNFKKIILREIAQELGLPKEFAWRKKLAAQYGSRFDKAIEKFAKKAGFEYKKEYLQSLL